MNLSNSNKEKLARQLWGEYLNVPTWAISEVETHAAHCAIRCCAVRLGVYVEFCALDESEETAGELK